MTSQFPCGPSLPQSNFMVRVPHAEAPSGPPSRRSLRRHQSPRRRSRTRELLPASTPTAGRIRGLHGTPPKRGTARCRFVSPVRGRGLLLRFGSRSAGAAATAGVAGIRIGRKGAARLRAVPCQVTRGAATDDGVVRPLRIQAPYPWSGMRSSFASRGGNCAVVSEGGSHGMRSGTRRPVGGVGPRRADQPLRSGCGVAQ